MLHTIDPQFANWVRLTNVYSRLCERAMLGRHHPELLRRVSRALALLEVPVVEH